MDTVHPDKILPILNRCRDLIWSLPAFNDDPQGDEGRLYDDIVILINELSKKRPAPPKE